MSKRKRIYPVPQVPQSGQISHDLNQAPDRHTVTHARYAAVLTYATLLGPLD